MKINTNTKLLNLVGEEFETTKGGKTEKLTLGDVLFGALNNATGIELKISWALLPKLALDNEEIILEDDQKKALIKAIDQTAQLPQGGRYNLVVYGRVLDILNGKVQETAPKKETKETKKAKK